MAITVISREHAAEPRALQQATLEGGLGMQQRVETRWLVALILGSMAGVPAWARAACSDFSWDVHQERALFAGQAQLLPAGSTVAAAPSIHPDQLYDLHLTSQPQVQFGTPPGKAMLADGAYAGMVRLRVAMPGSYRLSVDVPFWIDVVSDGKLLPTQDFQGQHGCSEPRKIVEFELPADRELLLQFSGATSAQLHLTVTRSPAAASH
jgi:hypothetical protein